LHEGRRKQKGHPDPLARNGTPLSNYTGYFFLLAIETFRLRFNRATFFLCFLFAFCFFLFIVVKL
jgi:hypothetical protein